MCVGGRGLTARKQSGQRFFGPQLILQFTEGIQWFHYRGGPTFSRRGRVLTNSKLGLFYSNFLILTPTFSKVPIEKYGKTPSFSGKQHFYSYFQNPSENSEGGLTFSRRWSNFFQGVGGGPDANFYRNP